jgi:ribulose-phosphate 3-epimerase
MEAAGADWIHLDVMDGHFVPNISFGPWVVQTAKRSCRLPLDVHLMVSDPLFYGPLFAKAGADLVTIHAEATVHHERAFRTIREAGAKPGLALNPSTPLGALEYCLDLVELVILMGVNPGFGGQPIVESVFGKIADLSALMDRRGRRVPIEIDGGVDDRTGPLLARAGADVLVSGSHLFGQADYGQAVGRLRGLAEAARGRDGG